MAVATMPGTGLERPLSPKQRERTAPIMAYDLSLVRERLLTEKRIKPNSVDRAIAEYRKFMALLALGHRGLAMCSPIVDEVWHAHILFTEDYAGFCHSLIGRFVHHQPATKADPIDPSARVHFLTSYQEVFGPLPRVWVRNQADGCSDEKCKGSTNCQEKCSVPSAPYCSEE